MGIARLWEKLGFSCSHWPDISIKAALRERLEGMGWDGMNMGWDELG